MAATSAAVATAELWESRLLDVDAEALRYRLVAAQLRPRQQQIGAVRDRVLTALADEATALDALEAESVRQQQQQQHALKYGQYLNVLSVHVAAASGGSISMLRLPPEADEVRHTLAELGAPSVGPMQVLHAYRLRNARMHEEFNLLASGGGPPLTHRLLAMRLTPSSVEHCLVHGLRAKPAVDAPLGWQVDPRSVPEAGCVDMDALAKLVGASMPPAQPFALFAGRAAWENLLSGAVEEAMTERDVVAAARRGARQQASSSKAKKAAAAAPHRPPTAPPHASAALAADSPMTTAAAAAAEVQQPRLLLLCRVLVTAPGQSDGHSPSKLPGTATADATHILPLHLLHYGVTTTPVTEGAALPEVAHRPAPLPRIAEGGKGASSSQQETGREARKSGGKSASSTRKAAASKPLDASEVRAARTYRWGRGLLTRPASRAPLHAPRFTHPASRAPAPRASPAGRARGGHPAGPPRHERVRPLPRVPARHRRAHARARPRLRSVHRGHARAAHAGARAGARRRRAARGRAAGPHQRGQGRARPAQEGQPRARERPAGHLLRHVPMSTNGPICGPTLGIQMRSTVCSTRCVRTKIGECG